MRGRKQGQMSMACLLDVETMIPAKHPIRAIKGILGVVLREMDAHFEELYATEGRPSIPPERLLMAKVLMALYTIRSERQFCERLQYDLLFRWFLDLNPDEPVFDHSTFSQNQARLLQHKVADLFFAQVVWFAKAKHWISNQHFSVDGTLIESWASLKSFQEKEAKKDDDPKSGPGDGNGWSDFKGEKRSNDTHESSTDPEAKLVRKGNGREAKLCFAGHATMENRNGLCVLFEVRPAVGAPESAVAVEQVKELQERGFNLSTVGADAGYCSQSFINGLRARQVVPHPAACKHRRTLGVRIGSLAYALSQRARRRIENIFGWTKTIGCFRRSRHRGVERTHAASQYVVATCNLVRMAKLLLGPPASARA
jgi:transposase